MKNRIISLLLAISMVICLFSGVNFNVSAEENLYSYVTSNGLTTITKVDTSISGDVQLPLMLGGHEVTEIAANAFAGCNSLTGIEITGDVYYIGESAFAGCQSLATVKLPKGITNIYKKTFYGCTALSSITIQEGVTSIGDEAFSGCSALSSIKIPNGVITIGEDAFSGCTTLSSIDVPGSVISIGNNAFYNTLWYNNLSDGLVIAGKVVYKYKGIMPDNTVMFLEKDTTGITSSAFAGCGGLVQIDIPDSVKTIGACAFDGTAWYQNQSDGLIYAGKIAYKYKGEMPENTEIELLKSTESISPYAFSGCANLTGITIYSGVKYIGDYAFSGCTGLEAVTVPSNTVSIGEGAFKDCSNLQFVYILSDNLTEIGIHAFNNTALKSICFCGYDNDGGEFGEILFAGDTEIIIGAKKTFHNYSEEYVSDNYDQHYKICNICGSIKDASPHSWDDGTEISSPTCTKSGAKKYSCSVCNASKTVELPAIGHKWNKGTQTKKPTCTATGETVYTCTVCGTKNNKVISAAGHKWDNGKVIAEATCVKAGTMSYTCKICKGTKTEAIPKNGIHKSVIKIIKPATFTAKGKLRYECINCDKTKTETINSLKTVKLSSTAYTYDGKIKKPAITVTDSGGKKVAGSNYSVTYIANKNVGRHAVKVEFKEKYSGTKVLYYKILPKGTSVSKLTRPAKKQIKVTWTKKTAQTTGYQIQYSKSKTFKSGNKTVTVTNNKTASQTVKNLKSNTTYYVRIRTYKTVGKTKYYSAWSKAKSVKTK